MQLIDTHSHIYDVAFGDDRAAVVERARAAGVERILLPAIDSESHRAMFDLVHEHPDLCCAMMGLHPTSVNDNPHYMSELETVERLLADPTAVSVDRFCGVGEVGLDFYWSSSWARQQEEAFRFQIELALRYDLPLVVHARDAWELIHTVLGDYRGRNLRGVMHAFSGSYQDYKRVRECGDFLFGIGGVVTYKRSDVAQFLHSIPLTDIVLETDSPYLTPVPFRGKRNESSYVRHVCDKVGELYGVSHEQVAETTTASARRMFGL